MKGKDNAKQKPRDTSWGSSAEWYSNYLETTLDSYQRQVILPNLLRILGLKNDMMVLDLACGQGFFAREFKKAGATVVGADIAEDLIKEAKRLSQDIEYHVAPADSLDFAKSERFDAVTIVLALQNIENMLGTFQEAARVLNPSGRMVLVLMHPAFRIPKRSSWGFDEKEGVQFRRVDRYLSSARMELLVHPGKKESPTTTSFHRSFQDYFKALAKAGFAVTRLEEWISHKTSGKGPRQRAEDLARKEIPMFLMLEAMRR